jgi:hypothetical protein
MPDRDGVPLSVGDPVTLRGITGRPVGATVLRDLGDDTYLVQMDPRDPTAPLPYGLPAELKPALDELSTVDSQEPVVVPGSELTFNGRREGDESG